MGGSAGAVNSDAERAGAAGEMADGGSGTANAGMTASGGNATASGGGAAHGGGASGGENTPADLNADGKLDLVTGNGSGGSVSVLLGKGDGTFAPKVDYGAAGGPYSVAVGDFDLDGKLDVAAAVSSAPKASTRSRQVPSCSFSAT